jgi:outer membrane protein OmpA-like peptidoglycan-associated protein
MQKLFILGLTLLGVNLHAQKSADPTDFNQYNFQKIVESNKNKFIAEQQDYRSQRRLAIAYSQLENHSMSLAAWQHLHTTFASKTQEQDFLELYRELRCNGMYQAADSVNAILQTRFENQQFKRNFPIYSDSLITVNKLLGNTAEGEYGLIPTQNSTAYLTRVSTSNQNTSGWLGKPHFQIDEVTFSDKEFQTKSTVLFSDNVHFEFNHKDAYRNIFVTTNDVNKKVKRDFNPLSIQIVKIINGKLSLQPLVINEKFANTAHISFSPNGKLAAFTSDRKGTLGKTDLYLVDVILHTKDTIIFGEVRHLGNEINTAFRETHPVFQSDSILFFSSDGYAGYGGLDIFKYNLNTKRITLMPAPINAAGDDLHFVSIENKFYFTSNRNNINYNDDIYSGEFIPTKPVAIKPETPAVTNKPVVAGATIEKPAAAEKPTAVATSAPKPTASNPVTTKPASPVVTKPTTPEITKPAVAIATPEKPAAASNPIATKPVSPEVTKPTTPKITKPAVAIATPEKPAAVNRVTLKIVLADANGTGNLGKQWVIVENSQKHGPIARKYFLTDDRGQLQIANFTTLDSLKYYSVSTEPCNYEFITSGQFKTIGDTAYMFLSPRQRKVGNSLAEEPQIKNIYYELDKYIITDESKRELDNLVVFLKSHPNIIIEITSHTDSRGSDAYNLKLSQNRAKAAKDYIVSQGIDPKRVSSIGLGESQLLNRCANNVVCSDQEHVINRRTEYVITKLNPCLVINKPTITGGLDTDGDGTVDDFEGFTDSDGDGIPNYLDPK